MSDVKVNSEVTRQIGFFETGVRISDFRLCSCPVSEGCRSRMNVPVRIGGPQGDEGLEKTFLQEAEANKLISLKGHR